MSDAETLASARDLAVKFIALDVANREASLQQAGHWLNTLVSIAERLQHELTRVTWEREAANGCLATIQGFITRRAT